MLQQQEIVAYPLCLKHSREGNMEETVSLAEAYAEDIRIGSAPDGYEQDVEEEPSETE